MWRCVTDFRVKMEQKKKDPRVKKNQLKGQATHADAQRAVHYYRDEDDEDGGDDTGDDDDDGDESRVDNWTSGQFNYPYRIMTMSHKQ